MIAVVLFWIGVVAIIHSYVFYPLILNILSGNKKLKTDKYNSTDELPEVYLLMAVYNEEAVLKKKLDSVFDSSYPADKIHFLIGSDRSSDGTNEILEAYATKQPSLNVTLYQKRTGKIGIIEDLNRKVLSEDAIVVMTDANVFFEKDTLFNLVRHFKDATVGLVGANVLNEGIRADGISKQEQTYIQGENLYKYQEGLLWGSMMGAFGACYAVRKSCFKPAPLHFRVDDFYVTLKVVEQKLRAINDLEALCYEDVSNEISEEFRRKTRIAIGNFQNLRAFASLLWPPFTGTAFAFLSHKVLRWLGPLFLLLAYVSNAALLGVNLFYDLTFVIQNVLLLLPFVDLLLKKVQVHSVFLRFVSYFYYMNLALAVGFFKYLTQKEDNVWEPTKRNL